MVGHQAISPNRDLGLQRLLRKKIEVDFVVAILKEDGLAAVAPLSDMVRKPRNHDTSKSSHVRTIALWGIGIMSHYSRAECPGPEYRGHPAKSFFADYRGSR